MADTAKKAAPAAVEPSKKVKVSKEKTKAAPADAKETKVAKAASQKRRAARHGRLYAKVWMINLCQRVIYYFTGSFHGVQAWSKEPARKHGAP